ncbi:MAG: helix-turn-helix domain-containing protein [Phycicoccus sp.]
MMQVRTTRQLGSAARAARRKLGLTQAQVAARLEVSRDWVVRLEQGHPRLEAQRVLDALVVLGVPLELADEAPASAETSTATDPFAYLTEGR